MNPQPIRPGYHDLTPSLVVRGGAAAIEFYQRAFGATVRHCMNMPDGKVMHAEMAIGDSVIMLSDEFPDWCAFSPQSLNGSPVSLNLYVTDCDAVFKQAVAAGANETHPVADQFWGDRMGCLEDPFGHKWMIATHKEDLPPDEVARRGAEWSSSVTD